MTHLTGRRMIPTLDHRKVFWWGEKKSLSIVDLETLSVNEFPMACGKPGAKLVTYDVMVYREKLIYIMYEDDSYKLIYYYDLKTQKLIGIWKYYNDDCKRIFKDS
jgi:hypothetical protein